MIFKESLDLYRKYRLQYLITKGFSEGKNAEDWSWIEGGFETYSSLMDQ